MPKWLRATFSILALLLTALGLVNVYSDNTDVVSAASKVACDGCETHLVQMGRSPIAQTMSFQVGTTREVVVIECQRAFVFLGEYRCEKRTN